MNLTAKTQTIIHASRNKVWDALTKPELVKKYMMGADVKSDWKVGSPLTYTGVYKDKPFEEKGVIRKIERDKLLQATHFSTNSGKEDKPENYALVTWELNEKDGMTAVTVSQDSISTEKGVEGSEANWAAVLKGLKQTVETPLQATSLPREVSTANANGHFVWHDNLTRDPTTAIAFYTDVVGWKTQPSTEDGKSDYVMWVGSQGPLGGVMKLQDQAAKKGAAPNWMGHVQVESVDATAALVKKLGGKVHTEPTDIPTIGRFAVIADPQGASISIFKPMKAMGLHDTSKAGEFSWNELMTSDSAAALKFYSEIFGWETLREVDMGTMGTYRVYGVGKTSFGGMMTIPTGMSMPPVWLYYAETSDLDTAIGRATKRGGKVTKGPMDVPDGSRIAQLTDPAGAAFALRQVPKE